MILEVSVFSEDITMSTDNRSTVAFMIMELVIWFVTFTEIEPGEPGELDLLMLFM